MSIKLQITLIICIVLFFCAIIHLLRKDALRLKYSFLWILTGIVLLIVGIFPGVMNWITSVVGIYDVTNGLFAIALFFILCMLLSITSIVSKLTNKNKDLTQSNALLEKRVRELENANNRKSKEVE